MVYEQAQKAFVPNGINRILLATDGDFNVGVSDTETLKSMVAEKRKSGVSLSTLGFGMGNYNEDMMEQIADAGDGNYSYIDNEKEAKKVLQQQLTSTLATVAQDVKIQVEFNPATVKEYRLVGYTNRTLRNEDFNNDKVDAGDIGSGQSPHIFDFQWCRLSESNQSPTDYKSVALPDELKRHINGGSDEARTRDLLRDRQAL